MAWISPIGPGLEMWRDRPGREPPHVVLRAGGDRLGHRRLVALGDQPVLKPDALLADRGDRMDVAEIREVRADLVELRQPAGRLGVVHRVDHAGLHRVADLREGDPGRVGAQQLPGLDMQRALRLRIAPAWLVGSSKNKAVSRDFPSPCIRVAPWRGAAS
jgi:hypothetical protein